MTAPAGDPFSGGVIDAHHHLYVRANLRYLINDYIADLDRAGLSVRASVYVQARAFYREDGPEPLRVWGETEFAIAAGRQAADLGFDGLCAGIVGAADLMLGKDVRAVLDGHLERAGHAAEGGRFCGIRHVLAWDPDARLLNPAYSSSEDTMERREFLDGLSVLRDLGLSFDAWLLAPQLSRLVRLAERFPDLPIILNHCGGPVGIGPYADRHTEVFAEWSEQMAQLSRCGNVTVKFGGLGMALSGLSLGENDLPRGPVGLARLWKPWFDHLLETFGAERMMLESNAPADRATYPFAWGWQAFRLLLEPHGPQVQAALCSQTAARIYRLDGGHAVGCAGQAAAP